MKTALQWPDQRWAVAQQPQSQSQSRLGGRGAVRGRAAGRAEAVPRGKKLAAAQAHGHHLHLRGLSDPVRGRGYGLVAGQPDRR